MSNKLIDRSKKLLCVGLSVLSLSAIALTPNRAQAEVQMTPISGKLGKIRQAYVRSIYVYATSATTGDVYQYNNNGTWTKIGGPGKEFVVDDGGNLYGITPDGLAIAKYSGTPNNWQKIGDSGPTTHLLAGGKSLYASNSIGIFKYEGGTNWTKIGGPGKEFVVDDFGNLYGITPDGQAVAQYLGSGQAWQRIGDGATHLYAGGNSLYRTVPGTGDIYKYQGNGNWIKIGGPGKTFTVGSLGQLYGITPDGQTVAEYSGTPYNWTAVVSRNSTSLTIDRVLAGGAGVYFEASNVLLQAPNPVQTASSPLPQGNYQVIVGVYGLQTGEFLGTTNTCFAFKNGQFNPGFFGKIAIVPAPGGWSADAIAGSTHLLVSGANKDDKISGTIVDLTRNGKFVFLGSTNNTCTVGQ